MVKPWQMRVGRYSLGGRVNLLLARLPWLRAKERIYNERYFGDMDASHDAMYERLADVLVELVHPETVVDVGCGTGTLLAKLARRGVRVVGVEGSRRAIEMSTVRNEIVRANLERKVPDLGRFDLALCIEVAEHLPGRTAPRLVAGLTSLSDRIVFTAARPGQWGMHHVNEQPREYWERLFSARGFRRSNLGDTILEAIADIPQPEWAHENLMAFERR